MNKNRTCPICGKCYNTYPAISRTDNKTLICPDCGMTQALKEFFELSRKSEFRDNEYEEFE
jgi:RNA polymerase subunit RPABC4/transcription elongation factor Spt4